MISTHCGTRLVKSLPHTIGYKVGHHEWRCPVCGRTFTQRIRRPTKGK